MSSVPRSLRTVAAVVLLAAICVPIEGASVFAQDLPECDLTEPVSQCRLPGWPESAQVDAPSPFGPVDGTVWVTDPSGDVAPNGLDIGAVGIGSVDIADPAPLRRDHLRVHS